jgi:hypothetical protein
MPSVADRVRKKLEKFEQRISQLSAKTQSKVRTQRVDVIVPDHISNSGQKEVASMRSSWIRNFTYDNSNHTLYMTTHKGKTYSWDNIDPDLAWQCIRGNAACTTNDRLKRWWIGKNPSLGAAYWTYLRNLTPHVTQPQYPAANPYFDIMDEGYTPRYNVDISRKGKKGRPTKEEDRSRKFGWAGRYKGVRA